MKLLVFIERDFKQYSDSNTPYISQGEGKRKVPLYFLSFRSVREYFSLEEAEFTPQSGSTPIRREQSSQKERSLPDSRRRIGGLKAFFPSSFWDLNKISTRQIILVVGKRIRSIRKVFHLL
jgi:hypothetical protein